MINDELRTIAMFYGNENQYDKLQEELGELIEAIDEDNLEHIAEEIADVEIMLEQIKYLSNLYETVKLQKDYKTMRQLQRVHKEALAKSTTTGLPSYEKAAKATLEFLEDRTRTKATAEKQKDERVDKPNHYMLDGLNVEAIDVIRAVLGIEGFKKHCRGCALKYLLRANKKNGLEDLKKARVYLNWEIDYGCDN